MKKFYRVVLALLVVTWMCGMSSVGWAAKKVIAITAFTDQTATYEGERVAAELEQALTVLLVKQGNFQVVERTQLDQVIKEIGFDYTGMVGENAVEFGHMVGADYTVVGNVVGADVTNISNLLMQLKRARVKFSLKFINNKTGVIEFADYVSAKHQVNLLLNANPNPDIMLGHAAKAAAKKAGQLIQQYMPLTGKVITVNGDNVYITLGSDDGLQEGEVLQIYREGSPLIHPDTGEVIGTQEQEVAKLKIKEVRNNYAIGEIKGNEAYVNTRCLVRRVAER